jgi:hypothetical protein
MGSFICLYGNIAIKPNHVKKKISSTGIRCHGSATSKPASYAGKVNIHLDMPGYPLPASAGTSFAGMTKLRAVIPAEAGIQLYFATRTIQLFSKAKCDSQRYRNFIPF